MEWKLIDVVKETNHRYLNYYTMHYEIKDGDKTKYYEYFLASRHDEDKLYALHATTRPDGVIIPCYYIDEKGEYYLLITSQFRPAFNRIVTSMPAGLMDPEDDIFSCAKREALEEGGVIIDNLEIIAPIGPTSSGFSDEINAIVMGQIVSFASNKLEEFEDISVKLIKIEDLLKMLDDPQYFFALNVRLLIKYLALRFKYEK